MHFATHSGRAHIAFMQHSFSLLSMKGKKLHVFPVTDQTNYYIEPMRPLCFRLPPKQRSATPPGMRAATGDQSCLFSDIGGLVICSGVALLMVLERQRCRIKDASPMSSAPRTLVCQFVTGRFHHDVYRFFVLVSATAFHFFSLAVPRRFIHHAVHVLYPRFFITDTLHLSCFVITTL